MHRSVRFSALATAAVLLLAAVAGGCHDDDWPWPWPPPSTTTTSTSTTSTSSTSTSSTTTSTSTPGGTVTIAAAGDISCSPSSSNYNGGAGSGTSCRQRAVSDLLVADTPDAVLTLGDNQYENGELSNFRTAYDPTWGRVKSITRPTPGNHEYQSTGAAGYYDYFGSAAGGRGEGYYSYNLGNWHVVALNSEIDSAAGSAQERWLRADLAGTNARCTIAYLHQPRFSSGLHGDSTSVRPLWQALYDANADVVLAGHDHDYERFAPMSPSGSADSARGLRSFVVGTGGKDLRGFGVTKPNSERRDSSSPGVLRMTLRADGYDWRFQPAAGFTFTDTGTGTCH